MYNPFFYLENPELLRYEYSWVNFVKHNKTINETIRLEILESWERCKKISVNYQTRKLPEISISINEISRKISKNSEILNTALPFMETLIEIVNEPGLKVQIIDKEGYLLKSLNNNVIANEDHLFYQIGSNLKEDVYGTNSIGMVLLKLKPFEVIGAEHYCEILHKTGDYAAPIFNSFGELVAILSMVGSLDSISKYTLGMVVAAAKAIENEIQLKETQSYIINQNKEQHEILETVTNGVIYVNEDGLITQANSEIAKMIGIKVEEITGKSINIIQSSPKMSNFLNSQESKKRYEIIVNGKNKRYHCFLMSRDISYRNKNKNKVLVFIKMEEIQELANQINNDNRAFFTFKDIVGRSRLLEDAMDLAMKASIHGSRVIIQGESGTGKELFAQAIHNNSNRANETFIAVDCGAIPRELLESELFGYEEGAFTGARKGGQRGKFELANKGTIFLDEIGNMPIDMQAKMLRVLQENCIFRIGGYKPIPIDVKVIAATNSDLHREVEKGNFREDLFYRLNVLYIKLPSLRDRKEDIPVLIHSYLNNEKLRLNNNIKIEDSAIKLLVNYDWPGNVRQLHNIIERMVVMSKGNIIDSRSVPEEIVNYRVNIENYLPEEIEPLEKATARYIKNVLDKYGGNIKKTSEALEISRTTTYRLLEKYNLI